MTRILTSQAELTGLQKLAAQSMTLYPRRYPTWPKYVLIGMGVMAAIFAGALALMVAA